MTSVKVKTTQKEKESKKKAAFKIGKEPYDIAMPVNFDFKTHKPLKKKNFSTEALYCDHRTQYAVYQVSVWKTKAEECRTLGSTKERRQKKQVVKLQSKMDELKKTLEGQGVDVEAILKAAAEAKTE